VTEPVTEPKFEVNVASSPTTWVKGTTEPAQFVLEVFEGTNPELLKDKFDGVKVNDIDVPADNYTVTFDSEKGTLTVAVSPKFMDDLGDGSNQFKFVFGSTEVATDVNVVNAATEEPTTIEPTTTPDATSATDAPASPDSTNDSTSDSANGNDGGNGAVQTGNASMAIIILLVLISATGAIFFARKRVK
ncbi:MAG TPA: hypothetical protein DEO32_00805, partial [Ruminococcaceae bacterium]|nr:hypothetical protein [Oscillospiraceae bacterium]